MLSLYSFWAQLKPSKRKSILHCLVLACSISALLPLVGYSKVFQVSEGREGVVVNEMLEHREFLLPLRHGQLIPSKPPLFHWLSAASVLVTGENTEFNLRVPSVIAAIGIIILLFNLCYSLVAMCPIKSYRGQDRFLLTEPEMAGLSGALILLTMRGFAQLAQDGRVDMLFSFFVALALSIWVVAAARVRVAGERLALIPRKTYWIIGASLGFGVLCKGPLALLLPLMIIGVVCAVEFGLKSIFNLLKPGLLLGIIIPAPWYLVSAFKDRNAGDSIVSRQLLFENISRFFGGEGITEKPFWFYLAGFWDFALPWSVVFGVIAIVYFRRAREKRRFGLSTSREASAISFGIRAGLIWLLLPILFFSFSVGKRTGYMLPLLPGLALFLSLQLVEWLRSREQSTQNWDWVFSLPAKLGGVVGWVVVMLVGMIAYSICTSTWIDGIGIPERLLLFLHSAGPGVEPYFGTVVFLYLLFSALSLSLWVLGHIHKRFELLILSVFFLLELILVVYVGSGLAAKGVTHSYSDFAEVVKKSVPRDRPLYFIKKPRDESFDGFFFYMGRRVILQNIGDEPEQGGLYLARRKWLSDQSEEFKKRITELRVGGRLVDEPDEKVVLFELQPAVLP